jgi:hypothetical protein
MPSKDPFTRGLLEMNKCVIYILGRHFLKRLEYGNILAKDFVLKERLMIEKTDHVNM